MQKKFRDYISSLQSYGWKSEKIQIWNGEILKIWNFGFSAAIFFVYELDQNY